VFFFFFLVFVLNIIMKVLSTLLDYFAILGTYDKQTYD